MQEMWKEIKSHEDYYEVSNFGNVRNKLTGKYIIGDINNAGYYRVCLYKPFKKRYFRHRLVASHFLSLHDGKEVVNHKDGNKSNNKMSNLEWCTASENEIHAHKTGLKDIVNRVKVRMIDSNGDTTEFRSITELSDFLNISVFTASYALKRGGWITKGIKLEKI